MNEKLKTWIFRLLGKDPEAVVVTFCTAGTEECRAMAEEVRRLIPDRCHFVVWPTEDGGTRVETGDGEPGPPFDELKRRRRIGMAAVMLTAQPNALLRMAYRAAPRKILAFNSRFERHHLHFDLASFLFWRGVPLDRIHLRPWWWPWLKREHSQWPASYTVAEGRPCSPERRRVAVLSPYFPYPLSHGGAVRIFNLLRETAREFDVILFSFTDTPAPETAPVLEHCARLVLVDKPRYREPRWSTLLPPEVHEFRSRAMRRAITEERRRFRFEVLQVEYTQLAEYGRDILVEHDVTFDLFDQILRRKRTLSTWWDHRRWRLLEERETRRYRRVVTMSRKDAELLPPAVRTRVIENGVDLARFRPEPESPGERLLFIGSFRHFPNIAAYQFFIGEVWPLLLERFPEMTLTVVCGPDHLTYWRALTDSTEPCPGPEVRLLGFVADVRPLYVEANLVIVPTVVSAGTNLKVLEAMAMERAVVSTSSGCAGLGLTHDGNVWVADAPEEFAAGVAALIDRPSRRAAMARSAREHAVRNFDWEAIGEKQRALFRSLLPKGRKP